MNQNLETELDKILDDINSIDDEFVRQYFGDEKEITELKEEAIEEEENFQGEDLEMTPSEKFSYNDILNRLDEKIDCSNPDNIIEMIERADTSEEFFHIMEHECEQD